MDKRTRSVEARVFSNSIPISSAYTVIVSQDFTVEFSSAVSMADSRNSDSKLKCARMGEVQACEGLIGGFCGSCFCKISTQSFFPFPDS